MISGTEGKTEGRKKRMKRIGALLKKEREKRNMSLEALSEKTRITVRRLKAIEDGDVAYFHDDTSVLKLYVRSYAKEVGLDYSALQQELELELKKYDEELNKAISIHTAEVPVHKEEKKESAKKRRHKEFQLDLTAFGTTLGILMLVGVIFYVLIHFVFPTFRHYETSEADRKENASGGEVVYVEAYAPVRVQKITDKSYEVADWNSSEALSIKIHVGEEKTYIGKFTINSEEMNSPVNKEYLAGEEAELVFYPNLDDEVVLHMQSVKGNQVFINNEEIEIDEKYADSASGLQLKFHFVEELTEIEEEAEDESTE